MSEGQIPCHETAVAINRLEHPAGAVLALSGARFDAVSFRVAAFVALSTYRNHCGGSVRFNSCLAVFAGTAFGISQKLDLELLGTGCLLGCGGVAKSSFLFRLHEC